MVDMVVITSAEEMKSMTGTLSTCHMVNQAYPYAIMRPDMG